MAILRTQAQAFGYAKGAGFTNAQAEIAAAIAMAETFTLSAGKPYCDFGAIGDLHLVDKQYGPSYGAWQVRSVLNQWGTGTYRDGEALAVGDPAFHAAAARKVFLSQGWKAWSTYNSGAYLGYMLQAAYNPKPTVPAGSYIVTGGDSLSAIGQKTGYDWRKIAAANKITEPWTIFPGNVLLLPDFPYTIKSGDTLSSIASNIGQDLDWFYLFTYNSGVIANPDRISVGTVIKIPRLR